MQILCSNNYIFEFFYNPFDAQNFEEITGLKIDSNFCDGEILTILKQEINGETFDIRSGRIQRQEGNNIIDWLKLITKDNFVDQCLSFYYDSFTLTLLEHNNGIYTICVMYDGSKPIPELGGYSGNLEDLTRVYSAEFQIDLIGIELMINELEKEMNYLK